MSDIEKNFFIDLAALAIHLYSLEIIRLKIAYKCVKKVFSRWDSYPEKIWIEGGGGKFKSWIEED